MKLLAPIAVIIAAASAGRVFNNSPVDSYANGAEQYQSGLDQQQHGLYSSQSETQKGYESASNRPEGEKAAQILGYVNENNGHQYHYGYETENGIKAEEEGSLHQKGTEARGAYSYKSDDGKVYAVSYIADENGFRPSGAHLPTPPPIPEEIIKSLEKNAKDEAAGIYDDGQYREHHESGHQSHQQYENGHQSIGYQSSGQSGANLAYNAHVPSYSGASLHHQPQSIQGSGLSYQASLVPAEPKLLYFAAGHGGASLGNQASSSHEAHSSSHKTLGHDALSGHQTSLGHSQSVQHASITHNAPAGHQTLLVHDALSNQQAPLGHNALSGHQTSLGHNAQPSQSNSLTHNAQSGHQTSLGNSYPGRQTSLGHNAHSAHQTSLGHNAYSGNQNLVSQGAWRQASFGHETNLGDSTFNHGGNFKVLKESTVYGTPKPPQVSGAHEANVQSVYQAPLAPAEHNLAQSGFTPSQRDLTPSYSGQSYLPPAGNGEYYGYQ